MDEQKLFIALGDQTGHKKLLKISRAVMGTGLVHGYLEKFVKANENVDVDAEVSALVDCAGHEGQCGECKDNVWYPCTEPQPE